VLRKFKGRKVFFFEKKKQKTFVVGRISYPPRSKADNKSALRDKSATANKSFLVLFFKKEHSFFALSPPQRSWRPARAQR
jgi:hypothetical protein